MNKYYSKDYISAKDTNEELKGISGSGGGCFPAKSQVKTFKGTRPIEHIAVGEKVISYDRFGEISIGWVVEKIEHKPDTYKDSLYFIYSKGENLFPLGITGNHAVYDNETKEHKLISDFRIGENLTTLQGGLKTISMINRVLDTSISVYNLIVEPQHTYVVNNLKVHNGGGGKKGDSPRAAQESPNTLQSSAIANILEVISHGEIEGVVGQLKGVTFDNTVVQNPDNSLNFQGIVFEERVGLPTQTSISGFDKVEGEISLPGTVVTASGVVKDIVNSNIDYARVTLKLPDGLWKQNKLNGDLLGYSVSYQIQTKVFPSGSYSTVLSKTFNDKTTSAWEIAHLIQAPVGATQWSIRVNRISPEDTTVDRKSTLTWSRLTEITDSDLSYDKIAYVGLSIPAEEVGNRVPARAYNVMGIKLQIPVNYDPILRTYGTSYWSGAFKIAWSNNPAWVLYDLITSFEYGMNNFLNNVLDVDIFAFYEAALYCDAALWDTVTQTYSYNLLDDGQGGTEVRFLFDTVIATQSGAWQLIHAIASNMRAVLVMKGNQISLLQDRPKDTTKIINTSNVIDGVFLYAGTEATSRNTAVNVSFNDKLDRFLPRVITEEDSIGIAKYGHNVREIVAYAATSESQARRLAKWALYSEINQFDLLSFGMALNIIDMEVGDVVSIMDDNYISDTNDYLTGRVKSVIGTSVVLDRPVTLQAGQTYTFGVMSEDYSIIEKSLITTPASTTDTLTLQTAPPLGNYTDHEFFCYSTGFIEPRQFLIQGIKETDKGKYSISAVFYDVNKFAAIEQGIVVAIPPSFNLIATVLAVVTNVTFKEYFLSNGIMVQPSIMISWDWDSGLQTPDAVTYSLRWRRDNNNYKFVHGIPIKEYEIPSVVPGVYEVIIEVKNIQGKSSLGTFATYNYRVIGGNSTLEPPTNFFVEGTVGTDFVGSFISLVWDFEINNETKTDTLLDYQLEVWTTDGITQLSNRTIKPNAARGGKFEYTLAQNITDYGVAQRQVQFKLYSRDVVGEFSLPLTVNFNNPVPVAPSFTLISNDDGTFIDITAVSDLDLAGYIVYRGNTAGFTPDGASTFYDDIGSYPFIQGDAGVQYYFVVAAYDTFGKTGLNLSTEQSSTLLNFGNVDKFGFTDLNFIPNDPTTNQVSWAAATVSINGASTEAIAAGNATWTTGILYLYFDKLTVSIDSTTDIGVAVSQSQILAAYEGGVNLKGGDGTAFINGSQLLAQSVGANQLVVNTAIITATAQIQAALIEALHVQNGAITNLKIGDIIKSVNYNIINAQGWQVDKQGDITSYGGLTLHTPFTEIILKDTFTDIAFGLLGNATIYGRTISKPTGIAAWDTNAYSDTGVVSESRFRFFNVVLGSVVAAGLTLTSSGEVDITDIENSFNFIADDTITITELGVIVYTHPVTHQIGNSYEIHYKVNTIEYYINAVLVRSIVTAVSNTYYLNVALNTVGGKIVQNNLQLKEQKDLPSGGRTENTGSGIKVYDNNDVLRIRLGDLTN